MIAVGTMLGPYRILAPLGAGGMGEVYRAHDPRLGRDAAIKVIPAGLARDPERIRRFELEARAAGGLSHPNICPIFDLGIHDGGPFVVMELLEGETLRARMGSGPISWRKAVEYAAQSARGLAAAHRKGIVHRDLKPENLFVTRDGLVKILDFGLAKLTRPDVFPPTEGTATISIAPTASGAILGTAGYMSPEQVRGEKVDARSDIFALGCVLFEMLTGRRPFAGNTPIEQMASILNSEPPPLAAPDRDLPPALDRWVRHCLEKNPDERFQSASDIAYDLEAIAGTNESGGRSSSGAAVLPRRTVVAVASGAALLLLGAWLGTRILRQPPPPEFHRLTYSRGVLGQARFAPDGSSIVYSASWDGRPEELFTTRIDNPGSRALELGSARILAVSSAGELAVLLRPRTVTVFERMGTLARVPLAGGAPRELLENVSWADWSPDGRELAVVHSVGGQEQLEYPAGRVLYRTRGWISHPRVSPDGNRVAFADHAQSNDDRGFLAVVDRSGNKRVIGPDWVSLQGLAWSRSGDRILFTASVTGFARSLHTITLSGRDQLIARAPNAMTVQDLAPNGQVLVSFETFRFDVRGLAPGENRDRDLSWLDHSYPSDLAADGKTLVISEWAEAAGSTGTVCVRGTDGSPVVALGHGQGTALSPDGKWVLTHAVSSPQYLLLPTGAGESRAIARFGIDHLYGAAWLPDGRSIVFRGQRPGHAARMYVQPIDGGEPRALTPEGVTTERPLVTPDGLTVWAGDSLYSVRMGPAKPAPRIPAAETPLRWGSDGHSVLTSRFTAEGGPVIEIRRHDTATGGESRLWRLEPSDPAGIAIAPVLQVSGDGRSYVYMLNRMFCDLYLLGGEK